MQFEGAGGVGVGVGDGEGDGRVDEPTSYSDAYAVELAQMRRLTCVVDRKDGGLYAMHVE